MSTAQQPLHIVGLPPCPCVNVWSSTMKQMLPSLQIDWRKLVTEIYRNSNPITTEAVVCCLSSTTLLATAAATGTALCDLHLPRLTACKESSAQQHDCVCTVFEGTSCRYDVLSTASYTQLYEFIYFVQNEFLATLATELQRRVRRIHLLWCCIALKWTATLWRSCSGPQPHRRIQ